MGLAGAAMIGSGREEQPCKLGIASMKSIEIGLRILGCLLLLLFDRAGLLERVGGGLGASSPPCRDILLVDGLLGGQCEVRFVHSEGLDTREDASRSRYPAYRREQVSRQGGDAEHQAANFSRSK